jgi:hypothetical protein
MVLLTPWALFQGAPPEVIERAKEEGDDELLDEGGNALEVGSTLTSPPMDQVRVGHWGHWGTLHLHIHQADRIRPPDGHH